MNVEVSSCSVSEVFSCSTVEGSLFHILKCPVAQMLKHPKMFCQKMMLKHPSSQV